MQLGNDSTVADIVISKWRHNTSVTSNARGSVSLAVDH